MKIGFNNRNNQGCLTEKITSLDVVKVHIKAFSKNIFVSEKFVLPTIYIEIYFTHRQNRFTYSEKCFETIKTCRTRIFFCKNVIFFPDFRRDHVIKKTFKIDTCDKDGQAKNISDGFGPWPLPSGRGFTFEHRFQILDNARMFSQCLTSISQL